MDLPWEYLYDTALDRFFVHSASTPIVRYLDLAQSLKPLAVTCPLKVLVMIASPSDYEQLDVEGEWQKIEAAVAKLKKWCGLIQLTRLPTATLGALQRQLQQPEHYHIFHFVGHGGFDQQTQDGVLLMEDEKGRSRLVSGNYLGTLLHDHPSLRLALLNACEGARTNRSDPFAGVAQQLVRQGIPAVIAMQFEITDKAAILLAQEFYAALADGYPVDGALAEARKAIFTAENDIEWGTPVLYLRAEDGQLFTIGARSRCWRVGIAVGFLTLLAVLLIYWLSTNWGQMPSVDQSATSTAQAVALAPTVTVVPTFTERPSPTITAAPPLNEMATAIALAGFVPTNTATNMPTPDVQATQQAEQTRLAVLQAATLAALPTETPTLLPTATPTTSATNPSTPTGKKLDRDSNKLSVTDLATNQRSSIVFPKGYSIRSAAWSPDGQKILVSFYSSSKPKCGSGLRIINSDGSSPIDIAWVESGSVLGLDCNDSTKVYNNAIWSPGGQIIAMRYHYGNDYGVFLADSDGTGLSQSKSIQPGVGNGVRLLRVKSSGIDDWPRYWSVDGKWIIAVSANNGALYAIEVNGQNRIPLTELEETLVYDQRYYPWYITNQPSCPSVKFWC